MAAAREKVLIILVDGLGLDYVGESDMPNLRRLAAEGVYTTGKAVLPSVTNVNNASVVTASFPVDHGIVSNFSYDRRTGQSMLVESAEFLERPTMFEMASQRGLRGALVTAKDKIKTLLDRGASTAFSAEVPDAAIVEKIGPPPGIYTAEVNHWVFRAARQVLRHADVDWLYVATTDYMMHTFAPGEDASLDHLHRLDALLGEIVDDHPHLCLGLTADHGMNAKTRAIDIARLLAEHGIRCEAVPIIRDKHVVHHKNLGGACYVYLHDMSQLQAARDVLAVEAGVEEIYSRDEAAGTFRLRAERIGDLFLLAARDTVFGSLRETRMEVKLRSHGSRYEQAIPMLLFGAGPQAVLLEFNLDVTRALLSCEPQSRVAP
jgi:phosphonoacetate hydrolase